MEKLKHTKTLAYQNDSFKLFIAIAIFVIIVTSQPAFSQVTKPEVPISNQTTLGLYVTPSEAYEMWKANPKKIYIIDVRTFEEYVLVAMQKWHTTYRLSFQNSRSPTPMWCPLLPQGYTAGLLWRDESRLRFKCEGIV